MMNQQSELERWWLENKGPLLKEGFTQEDLQHAAGLVGVPTHCQRVVCCTTDQSTLIVLPQQDGASHSMVYVAALTVVGFLVAHPDPAADRHAHLQHQLRHPHHDPVTGPGKP